MIEAYRAHTKERWQLGIPPLPLDAEQVAELVELLKSPPAGEEDYILDLITNSVPPGVDEAAYVKAAFLSDVASGAASCPLIDRKRAAELLGTMMGGYNIESLVKLLEDEALAETAAEQLSRTLLMFDAFHDVAELAKGGNAHAQRVLGRGDAEAHADGDLRGLAHTAHLLLDALSELPARPCHARERHVVEEATRLPGQHGEPLGRRGARRARHDP